MWEMINLEEIADPPEVNHNATLEVPLSNLEQARISMQSIKYSQTPSVPLLNRVISVCSRVLSSFITWYQSRDCVTLRQSAYAKKVVMQFGMSECNPTKYPMEPKLQLGKDVNGTLVNPTEYRRVIGCLRYLTHTRPDLSYSVGLVSRYMERPTTMHHQAVKQILRYVKGTISYGLVYGKGHEVEELVGFTDSNVAGDVDDRRSTSGMHSTSARI
ncbi:uncharacterized protein LOC109826599 [Asparagus officinalis]|uniref:uncharacterized protein LOC109826599 n=1 Tax=Asparagus officinalis TaxID=4686 RepID=UPI00098DE227|nr:uncharacterized protein LOC109826599 [Asparagus officinalis]